jgi:hypothetical protein
MACEAILADSLLSTINEDKRKRKEHIITAHYNIEEG